MDHSIQDTERDRSFHPGAFVVGHWVVKLRPIGTSSWSRSRWPSLPPCICQPASAPLSSRAMCWHSTRRGRPDPGRQRAVGDQCAQRRAQRWGASSKGQGATACSARLTPPRSRNWGTRGSGRRWHRRPAYRGRQVGLLGSCVSSKPMKSEAPPSSNDRGNRESLCKRGSRSPFS